GADPRRAPAQGASGFRERAARRLHARGRPRRLRRRPGPVRSRLGGDHPLVIDGRRVPTAEFIVSVNPSRAGEVVGRVADAGAAARSTTTRARGAAWWA